MFWSIPRLGKSVSPALALHPAFRANANRPNPQNSSLEHSRTWRQSKRDE